MLQWEPKKGIKNTMEKNLGREADSYSPAQKNPPPFMENMYSTPGSQQPSFCSNLN
jgi:hypothetical protein